MILSKDSKIVIGWLGGRPPQLGRRGLWGMRVSGGCVPNFTT